MASDGHHSRTLRCDEHSGQRKALKESGGACVPARVLHYGPSINSGLGWLGLSAGASRNRNSTGSQRSFTMISPGTGSGSSRGGATTLILLSSPDNALEINCTPIQARVHWSLRPSSWRAYFSIICVAVSSHRYPAKESRTTNCLTPRPLRETPRGGVASYRVNGDAPHGLRRAPQSNVALRRTLRATQGAQRIGGRVCAGAGTSLRSIHQQRLGVAGFERRCQP
jgi:hypothetical protein